MHHSKLRFICLLILFASFATFAQSQIFITTSEGHFEVSISTGDGGGGSPIIWELIPPSFCLQAPSCITFTMQGYHPSGVLITDFSGNSVFGTSATLLGMNPDGDAVLKVCSTSKISGTYVLHIVGGSGGDITLTFCIQADCSHGCQP